MRIAYAVEGSTDMAFVRGLWLRWCSRAELVKAPYRGSSRLSRRRELTKTCVDLRDQRVDVLVILTDANREEWRDVRKRELGRVPSDWQDFTICGVPDRNVECWLRLDAGYLASCLGVDPAQLGSAEDPKGIVHKALGHLSGGQKLNRIATLVQHAPIRVWLERSPSFRSFHDDARSLALRQGCSFPNEREA